jgi:hypothetical protein
MCNNGKTKAAMAAVAPVKAIVSVFWIRFSYVLLGLLYRRMISSEALKEDLAHFQWERAKGEGAENYTSRFRKSINKFIASDKQDKNLADRQHAPAASSVGQIRC